MHFALYIIEDAQGVRSEIERALLDKEIRVDAQFQYPWQLQDAVERSKKYVDSELVILIIDLVSPAYWDWSPKPPCRNKRPTRANAEGQFPSNLYEGVLDSICNYYEPFVEVTRTRGKEVYIVVYTYMREYLNRFPGGQAAWMEIEKQLQRLGVKEIIHKNRLEEGAEQEIARIADLIVARVSTMSTTGDVSPGST